MKIISQRDPKWSGLKIGKSPLTIGMYGCALTSLSMLSDWYGDYKDPAWIAKNLEFTKEGLILWSSMNGKLPMNFVYRYYKRDDVKIKQVLASARGAVLLQVNNGKHWVVLVGYSRLQGFKIADPFYGDVVFLNKRYPNITGWVEVIK